MLCDLRPTIAPLRNFVATPLSIPDVPAAPTSASALRARRGAPPRPGSRAGRRRAGLRALLPALLLGLGLDLGCARRNGQTEAPKAPEAAGFSDAPLLGAQGGPTADPNASPAARVARLDRLLDLFDAARFADDAGARESLWEGLGGAAMGRGDEATREATARLLDEALTLEDLPTLSGGDREFVGSAILLLSTDLHRPTAADDLSIRTAAYRELVRSGHPRIVDNARWRIYDHVRGCLAGAVAAPPERRPEIAVHSLYVEQDSIEGHLDDKRSVHARPSLPAPAELWGMLAAEREALAAIDRWAPVVERRSEADEELKATALASLPAPRDPTWDIAEMPAGTGRAESLAPILRVDGETLIIDEGRPQERRERLGSPEAARALEGALVQDGRGVVLFVAPTMLPSPALRTALLALLSARVATVEIAVREPRVDDDGDVVVALPVEIVRDTDKGPAAIALRGARLHIHLDGRGPRFAVDGRWLDARPQGERELKELLDRLDRAFPRERMITLSLGKDVLLQQVLDLLKAITGGTPRRYDVAAWSADRDPEAIATAKPVDAEDRRVARRAELFTPSAATSITQPFPLPGDDQKRLEAMAKTLPRCLPELEAAPPKDGLRLKMVFEEGRMSDLSIAGKRRPKKDPRGDALLDCVRAETRGFRLREQRDAVTIEILLRP